MNLKSNINKHIPLFFLLIPIVSISLHWRIFTTDLLGIHLWRQSQTELNIQNFYRHDFNIMNPRHNNLCGSGNNIMRYEFPIMQWLIAAAHKVFGESIVVMRISMFTFGILGVLGMYFLLKWLWNDKIIALLGAWAFNFSPVFYYYTMNPLPDLFALCSTVWAMAFFFLYLKNKQKSVVMLSALCLSIATLAKLPYIIFGSMVGIYVIQQFIKKEFSTFKELIFLCFTYSLFLLPALIWYKWVIPTWGNNGVLKGIFDNQIPLSKTLTILQFHVYELLPKILLNHAALPFFFLGLFFIVKNRAFKHDKWPLLAAAGLSVIVYFLLELDMIDTVHDYYMLPFLPPLFIIVAYGIKQLLGINVLTQLITIISLLLLPFFAFQAVDNYWRIEQSGLNPDVIKNKDELRKAVPNNSICLILNVNDQSNYAFPYQIDKRGHIFNGDNFAPDWIEDIIKRFGIRYMYSDNRKIDENPIVTPFIDSLIMQRGSVKVFKLKDL